MNKFVNKLGVQLMSAALLVGMGFVSTPVMAQDSGVANTAEDFKRVDGADGILGSGQDIWSLFHQAGRLSGAGVVDSGWRRSQSRRINSQAESLRERQRAAIEAREAAAAETAPTAVPETLSAE